MYSEQNENEYNKLWSVEALLNTSKFIYLHNTYTHSLCTREYESTQIGHVIYTYLYCEIHCVQDSSK